MKSILATTMSGVALCASMPAAAQTVSANDPASIVGALEMAGYRATLSKDTVGDPKVVTELSDREIAIVFYGCANDTHEGCDQLQFIVGFDADEPMEPQQLLDFMDDWRFASLTLDDEGDPWMTWDVVTGQQGIPTPVFLQSIRLFTDTLDAAEEMIWPG